MQKVLVLMLLGFMAGCVTAEVQTACRRSEKFAAEKGAEGDEVGAAVAAEMAAANKMLGADKIADADVELSAPAASANTKVLDEQFKQKDFFKGFFGGLVGLASKNVPAIATAISLFGIIAGLGKKLLSKGRALRASITMTDRVKREVASDKPSLKKFKGIYNAAKEDGPAFVAGARELYAEYKKLKAKAEAKKT